MRMKLFAVLALCATLPGCAPNFRDGFFKRAKAKGWTEEQQYAALYASYRLYFAKEADDGQFTVLFSRLPIKDVREQLDQRLSDLSDYLDYQNPDSNQYITTFGLRKHFEHQEEIFKAIRARVRVAELNDVFEQLVGDRSYSYVPYGEEPHGPGYNPTILTETDMVKKFPFTSKTVQDAKDKGLLQVIETFAIRHTSKYDHKEPDPVYPTDPNKFVWRSREYQLEVTKYKITEDGTKPNNNFGNYLEAFRIVDGKKESKPALKAYLDGSGGYAVAVIDADFENKATGFGLPDFVDKLPEGTLADQALIDRLFPDEPKTRRVEPPKPPIRLEIARVGETVDVWEKNPSGWPTPSNYKVEPTFDNYNVRVKFLKAKKGEDHEHATLKPRQVEYLVKEYTAPGPGNRYTPSPGNVVEYYKPKPAYSGATFIAAQVQTSDTTKTLKFVSLDGTQDIGYLTPLPNKYIGDKPSAISYKLGDKWLWLQDDDGDGKYEKRKEVGPPQDETGVYKDELSEYRPSAVHDDMGDMSGGDLRKHEAIKPKQQ